TGACELYAFCISACIDTMHLLAARIVELHGFRTDQSAAARDQYLQLGNLLFSDHCLACGARTGAAESQAEWGQCEAQQAREAPRLKSPAQTQLARWPDVPTNINVSPTSVPAPCGQQPLR